MEDMDYDKAREILGATMSKNTYEMLDDQRAAAGAALAFLLVDIAQSLDAIATHMAGKA